MQRDGAAGNQEGVLGKKDGDSDDNDERPREERGSGRGETDCAHQTRISPRPN